MVTVILTHEVADATNWKKAFDEGASMRQQANVKTVGAFQSIDNPNVITVITEFPSADAVRGFMNNPHLREAMEKSGVVGAPEVKILNSF